jgi:uncharacterized protein YjbI with pentapeptide repeats
VDAEAFEFEGCRFDSGRFTGTELRTSQFSDSTFDTCDFAQATMHAVSMIRCTVKGSRITGSSWKAATFRDVRFENCDLTSAQFANVELGVVRFDGCTLIDVGGAASLKGATVSGPGVMEVALSLAHEAGIFFE